MTIKRRANAALFQIMDPDDQIVAGTWALTGPPVWLDLLHAPSLLRIVPLLGQWVPPVELLVPGRRAAHLRRCDTTADDLHPAVLAEE